MRESRRFLRWSPRPSAASGNLAQRLSRRYWTFQWYETAIFLALVLALAGVCFWWIRHRLA